jgi:hypothetical protein
MSNLPLLHREPLKAMGIGACVALLAIAPSFFAPPPPPPPGVPGLEDELQSFRHKLVTVASSLRIHGDCRTELSP